MSDPVGKSANDEYGSSLLKYRNGDNNSICFVNILHKSV